MLILKNNNKDEKNDKIFSIYRVPSAIFLPAQKDIGITDQIKEQQNRYQADDYIGQTRTECITD